MGNDMYVHIRDKIRLTGDESTKVEILKAVGKWRLIEEVGQTLVTMKCNAYCSQSVNWYVISEWWNSRLVGSVFKITQFN